MAEPDKKPVTLQELLVSSLAQTDALAKLLIEKGLITREEFMAKRFVLELIDYELACSVQVYSDYTDRVYWYERGRKLIDNSLTKTVNPAEHWYVYSVVGVRTSREPYLGRKIPFQANQGRKYKKEENIDDDFTQGFYGGLLWFGGMVLVFVSTAFASSDDYGFNGLLGLCFCRRRRPKHCKSCIGICIARRNERVRNLGRRLAGF
jgi:hypothetical protein